MNAGKSSQLGEQGFGFCFCTTLRVHVTIMLISCFDTDFPSQIHLIKLPFIHGFYCLRSVFFLRECVSTLKYMIIKHQLLSAECTQLRKDPEHDPYDNDHKRAIVNNKYMHFTSHEPKSRKVLIFLNMPIHVSYLSHVKYRRVNSLH